MSDIFQGDPRLVLDENGADLPFRGGQPIMDRGLENLVLISLFTKPGWAGNVLFPDENQKIGSDFEDSTNQAITLQSLNDTRQAALEALKNDAFADVDVEVTNPVSTRRDILIKISPPGRDQQTLLLQKNGTNWIFQKLDPAHRRL